MSLVRYSTGSIHGRFQPFHLGHLEYFLESLRHCEQLIVGITQVEVESLVPTPEDPHRNVRKNNPLTFDERSSVITEALVTEGVDLGRVSIRPFPLEFPQTLAAHIPLSVVIFTTILDDWNRHKVSVLESAGYRVEVLWERTEKPYEGQEIRKLIREGNDLWRTMVPMGTAKALDRLDIRGRLLLLEGAED